jgi:hypothetical protein
MSEIARGVLRVKCIDDSIGTELSSGKEYSVRTEYQPNYYDLYDTLGGWLRSRFVVIEDKRCPQCKEVH